MSHFGAIFFESAHIHSEHNVQNVMSLHVKEGGAVAWWLTPWTPDSEVGGSSPTRVAVLCPGARHIYPQKSTGNTQEAVALSQHD